ncbi:DUF2294 domain-containing protein [Coleofasciculus sp. FACHB-1120]|uniref:DUF2294 domain-containing protein n=1 Tax=Coleofasciculus sp. FACHB-1120 TaxID=2692783 RepID=UPI001689A490|nr:DUF2294 domain-containing protein [Coleofasciculus sp. FACHB-1120]MBD2741732.1 DUF2294 domain-containing protein [Coleofasciculus sp. FACHB-1120]
MQDTIQSTCGDLERTLSQEIRTFYHTHLGHQPSKVTCQFMGDKIAILIENSITQPEKLLAQRGQQKLAETVRASINHALQLPLKQLIEEVVKVPVIDLMIDSALKTSRTSTVAVLAAIPKTRNPS